MWLRSLLPLRRRRGSKRKVICELTSAVQANTSLLAKANKALGEKKGGAGTFSPEINKLAGAAAGKFCGALFALWPWTASGLVMSDGLAFGSGIAQV